MGSVYKLGNQLSRRSVGGVRLWRPVSGPTPPPPGNPLFKFNNGYYVAFGNDWSPSEQVKNFDRINYFAAFASIKGFQLTLRWKDIETAQNVYSSTVLQTYLTKLESLTPQRHLMVQLVSYSFATINGAASFPSDILPTYLAGAAYGPTSGSRFGAAFCDNAAIPARTACYWEAATMDRLCKLLRAMGQMVVTYGGITTTLDQHPLLETISPVGETAIGGNGVTAAAYTTQVTKTTPTAGFTTTGLFQEVRNAFPHTSVRWSYNYFPGSNQTLGQQCLVSAISFFIGQGGPDCCWDLGTNPRSFEGDNSFCGQTYTGLNTVGTPHAGWIDYRLKGWKFSQVQAQEMVFNPAHTGEPHPIGDCIPANNYQHMLDCKATHGIIYDNGAYGPQANRLDAPRPNLIDFLEANPLLNTAYPTLGPFT